MAAEVAGQDAGDSPLFKPLVEKTADNFTVQVAMRPLATASLPG
jgi:hypothetical protein